MSLEDGTSSKESFKAKDQSPKLGAKTQRPLDNGRIGGKSTKGTKK